MRLILLFCLLSLFLSACTSTRTVSVSVDKAEKVEVHVKDSLNSYYPQI